MADDFEYPPCEWEQCGVESVIAIVGEAGDIWLCPLHHLEWISNEGGDS
jgi:hypothetical protein